MQPATSAPSVLYGKRVVVTQATHQAGELVGLLEQYGARPLLYPCIAIEPPADTAALDAALCELAAGQFGWLVLTSANTVRVLAERLNYLQLTLPIAATTAIAAVGPATAAASALHLDRTADVVPDEHVAEGLAAALGERLRPGQRVLLPQGDLARPVLVESLTAAGAEVTSVVAYRTTIGSGGVDLAALLAEPSPEPGVDAITFTSASTVHNLVRRLETEGGDKAQVRSQLQGMCLACIGPVTAKALPEHSLEPTVVAAKQSIAGLVEALISVWSATQ